MSDVLEGAATRAATAPAAYPLGVSRPPLEVADLPTPEEVYGVAHFGRREAFRYAVGPSLIGLGAAIGSGEWILGPLTIGKSGFLGIGWLITVAMILQGLANFEIGRYITATGEAPIAGFARVPPGRRLWVPLSLVTLYGCFVLGGWAKAAAKSLFALLEGRPALAGDAFAVNVMTFLLLGSVVMITLAFRRITRGLELMNGLLITVEIGFLVVLSILTVPFDAWWTAIEGFLRPAVPPAGTSATDIGAVLGYAGLTAGVNWAFFAHYRDKGYGMGHRCGFLAGGRGEQGRLRSCGYAFPDDEINTRRWKRWMGLLRLDMYGVFLPGAMIGMLLPSVLVRHLAVTSGTAPSNANIETFAASILGTEHGRWLFYATLLIGFLIIFDTLIGILEVLVRNATDAVMTSPHLEDAVGRDLRKFYFPAMVALILVIGSITTLTQPATLVQWSANLTNAGALVFPFALIYLNRRLPKAARPPRYAIAALVANAVFFGFFFINFVVEKVTGSPLLTF